jgi:hypothetical protein
VGVLVAGHGLVVAGVGVDVDVDVVEVRDAFEEVGPDVLGDGVSVGHGEGAIDADGHVDREAVAEPAGLDRADVEHAGRGGGDGFHLVG